MRDVWLPCKTIRNKHKRSRQGFHGSPYVYMYIYIYVYIYMLVCKYVYVSTHVDMLICVHM